MKLFKNILRWIVGLFFGSTILVVVLYKFLPVVVTPLMVIRSIENLSTPEPITWSHTWVSLDEMSKYLPVAVIASEDQRFLEHHGFDFVAIEQAAKRNKKGGKVYGASTITQQTAKNVFLWPGNSMLQRWVRKGFEAYFTVLIELIWGKERIMEVYLNSIEMGPSIYGAEAVANEHFHCNAADLSRSQCALIAATLPNPRKFSSKTPSQYMLKRQRAIGIQMRYIPLFKQKE